MTIFDVDSSCDSDGKQLSDQKIQFNCIREKMIQYTREEMLVIRIYDVDPLPNFVINIREKFGDMAAIILPGEEFEEIKGRMAQKMQEHRNTNKEQHHIS